MTADDYSVFVDISVLLDYYCSYSDTHTHAKMVLDEIYNDGGELVISKIAGEKLTERLTNRQELFEYLTDEASRCLREYNQSTDVYKGQVLNRDNLQSNLSLGLNANYDISELRSYLEEVGLREFRRAVDDFAHEGHYFQNRLEMGMIGNRFSKGGRDFFHLKLALESKSDDPIQVESMLDAFSWNVDNQGDVILVRHTDALFQEREDIIDTLPQGADPDIRSPKSLESIIQ